MKVFHSEVRSDFEIDMPHSATFTIDRATAAEIQKLSELVRDNGLYKVEKFDYRVNWYDVDKEWRTDADCLHVSADEFWFSAYPKFCNEEMLTEKYGISELDGI